MNDEFFSELNLDKDMMTSLFRFGGILPGGFFVYRAEEPLDMIYVNDATLRIFGCDTLDEFKALTGYTFRGMVHPEDFDGIQGSIDSQIADENNKNLDYVEYRIIRRDGEVRWVDDYGHFAHLDGYGDVYYVFIWDVTDKRRAREERFRMEVALEQEKRASEVKSCFLFNVSHDIRTPLNAITGFSDLARRHADDPALLADYLGKVSDSTKQLTSLIDDLLEMNALSEGRFIIHSEPADLRELLRLSVEMFSAAAEKKGLTIENAADLPDERVLIDANRFSRIMGNLIDNAVKFTPPGGRITVSAKKRQATASGYARYAFTVADNGIGISEEFAARMFGIFEREKSSTVSGAAGTGLGLSIVKAMLDVMGGSISVTTKQGEGSEFTVELPLKCADCAAPEQNADDALPSADGKRRLLLVEDIEINRMLAEAVLTEAGFAVESVPDGCDAVDAVKNRPAGYYDLVLMDIQMPVMNGYEATRAIRALDAGASLPILALSANASDEDKRMSLECGMNGHIAKPFDAVCLISAINEQIAMAK